MLPATPSFKQPEIIVIVALTEAQRVIGCAGKLPWRIPADLQRFKQLTLGHAVVMGRRTWETDLQQRPLPGRCNIVVSTTLSRTLGSSGPEAGIQADHTTLRFAPSLTAALELAQSQQKVFMAGGATIYAQSLNLADRLELTIVEADYPGDVFFPDYQPLVGTQFKLVQTASHPGYRFESYQRYSAAR